MVRKALALASFLVACAATCATNVACGSSCTTDGDCPSSSGKALCCQGACVAKDESHCGQCGSTCLLGTKCNADHCVGTGTSACAITEAMTTSTATSCDLDVSWVCISGSVVSCHCDGASSGTCICPSGNSIDATFMCPTCDATLADLTLVATSCNVSAPTQ